MKCPHNHTVKMDKAGNPVYTCGFCPEEIWGEWQ